jgi:hypothetical protein
MMIRLFVLCLFAAGSVWQAVAIQGAESTIYQNDFDDPPRTTYAEWSSSQITYRSRATGQSGTRPAPMVGNCESPNKEQRFLGEFGGPHVDATAKTDVEQTVTLTLKDLPAHKSLAVSFDLYVLRSWDGDSPGYGPDRLRVEVDGGPKLLDATFSNNPKTAADGSWQSYPAKHKPPQTGAATKNTLGCNFFGDSAYHFAFTFDHADATLKLHFVSSLFEGKGTEDEAWGLDNVRLRADSNAAPRTANKTNNKAAPSPQMRRKTVAKEKNQGGFEPLFDGDDASQFQIVGLAADDVVIRDGELRLSGKTKGYVATRQSYRDYVLRFEWMFERAVGWRLGMPFHGNSGLLVHIDGPDKVWPKAIEVQVWHKHEYGDFFTFAGARFDPRHDDHQALARYLKPVGEWNEHEVTCRDDKIALAINGHAVAQGLDANPAAGRIGFMSEDGPVRFRAVKIKKLD